MDPASRSFLMLTNGRKRMLGVGHYPPTMRDQLASSWCGNGSLANAIYELQATAVFKLPDLLADRRLRQMQPLRGPGEAAEFRDFNQGTQLIEVQVPHDKGSLSGRSE